MSQFSSLSTSGFNFALPTLALPTSGLVDELRSSAESDAEALAQLHGSEILSTLEGRNIQTARKSNKKKIMSVQRSLLSPFKDAVLYLEKLSRLAVRKPGRLAHQHVHKPSPTFLPLSPILSTTTKWSASSPSLQVLKRPRMIPHRVMKNAEKPSKRDDGIMEHGKSEWSVKDTKVCVPPDQGQGGRKKSCRDLVAKG